MANYNSMLSQMQQSNTLQNTIMNAFVGNIMKEIFQDVDPAVRYANQQLNLETASMSQAGLVAMNSLRTFNTNFPAELNAINAKWNTQAVYDKYTGVKQDNAGNITKVGELDPLYGKPNMDLVNQLHKMELDSYLEGSLGSFNQSAKTGDGYAAGLIQYRDPATQDWKEQFNPTVQKFAQDTLGMANRLAESSMFSILRSQQHYQTASAFEGLIEGDKDRSNQMYDDERLIKMKGLIDTINNLEEETHRVNPSERELRQYNKTLDEMEQYEEVLTKIATWDTDDELAGIQLDKSKFKNIKFDLTDSDEDKQIADILGLAGANTIKNINGQTEVAMDEAARAIDYFVNAKDFDNAKMILDKFIVGNTDRTKIYGLRKQLRQDAIKEAKQQYNGKTKTYKSYYQGLMAELNGISGIGFVDKDNFFGWEVTDQDEKQAQQWDTMSADVRDNFNYALKVGGLDQMTADNFASFKPLEQIEPKLHGLGTQILDLALMGRGGAVKGGGTSENNWRVVKFDNVDYILHRTGDENSMVVPDKYKNYEMVSVDALKPNQTRQVLETISFGTDANGNGINGIKGLTNEGNFTYLQGVLKLGNPDGEANKSDTKYHTAFPSGGMAFKEAKGLVAMSKMYQSLDDIYTGELETNRVFKRLDSDDSKHNNTTYDDEYIDQYTDNMQAHNIGNIKSAKNSKTRAWYESDWDGTTALNLSYADNDFINGGDGFNSAKATWYLLGHHAYNNDYSIADLANKGGWTADNKEDWIKNVSNSLGVTPDSKLTTLELGDVVKAIGIAEGTLTKDSVIPSLEQLGGSETKLMAKAYAHPNRNKISAPRIPAMDDKEEGYIDAMAQAKKVQGIQTAIDLLENEMGVPLSERLQRLDTLLAEKKEFGGGESDYWVSEGRQEWRNAVGTQHDLARKFYSEAKRAGMVGWNEWSIVGSEVDEAEEMMTDYNNKGAESKYSNPTLKRILIDYNEAVANVDSITAPLRNLAKKEEYKSDYNPLVPSYYGAHMVTYGGEDKNMFDNLAMSEDEVRKAGFLYSGRSDMGYKDEILKGKLADISPEAKSKWTSQGMQTRDEIHKLNKEIADHDPDSGTENSFKSRLAALNTQYQKEYQTELVEYNLRGDANAAIELLELLTEQANLAAR